MKILLCLVVFTFLFSCNTGSSNGSNKDKDDLDENCVRNNNGDLICTYVEQNNETSMPPIENSYGREYFEQFLFAKEDVSDDPDFPEYQFRFLMSGLQKDFTTSNGEKRGATLKIGLFSDDTFKAVYNEIKYFGENGGFFPAACKKITGSWTVTGEELILTNEDGIEVFSGLKHFQDNQHMVMVNLKDVQVSPEALSINFDMGYGYTNSEYPEDQLFKCIGNPF